MRLIILLLIAAPVRAQDGAGLEVPPMFAPARWAERESQDPVLKAMAAEFERDWAYYGNSGDPTPYYMDWTAYDRSRLSLSAELGSLVRREADRSVHADVLVRVGDEKLDNTRKTGDDDEDPIQSGSLPLQADDAVIRAEFWRLTRTAVSEARRRFETVEKHTAAAARKKEDPGDFNREKGASRAFEAVSDRPVDAAVWVARLRATSAGFKSFPHLIESSVELTDDSVVRWFVSSGGARLRTRERRLRVMVRARTRAEDGMDLDDFHGFDADTPEGLPSEAAVRAAVAALGERLEALRRAPVVQPYAGPVLFDGDAAAVFFHEILGHHLEAQRQKNEAEAGGLKDKVGERIMSPILTVRDDPTRRELGGVFLRGHYSYDDEGMPSADVLLVKDGVLKSWLLSRSPVKGFARSNGHGRRSQGRLAEARQGNLLVTASPCVSENELRKRLRDEARARGLTYGLRISAAEGGVTQTSRDAIYAFKVEPRILWKVPVDGGPEEMLRGGDVVGTPLAGLQKVAAAGCRSTVFNGTCGATSGWVPVSAAGPSLLLSDLEIALKPVSGQRPPVLKSPASARRPS